MRSSYRRKWLNKSGSKNRYSKRNYLAKSDPVDRIIRSISERVRLFCEGKYRKGTRTWFSLVGYSKFQLKQHIEKQFDDQMSWGNYGSYWEVDHVVPISWFNNIDAPAEFLVRLAWGLENLKPMASKENKQKYNKLDEEAEQAMSAKIEEYRNKHANERKT